jgi:hypothetical protein
METICSSETSVYIISTWSHIPEDGIFHSHRRETLKSYIFNILFYNSHNKLTGPDISNGGEWYVTLSTTPQKVSRLIPKIKKNRESIEGSSRPDDNDCDWCPNNIHRVISVRKKEEKKKKYDNSVYTKNYVKKLSFHILTTYSSLLISLDFGVWIWRVLLPTMILNTTVKTIIYANVKIIICLFGARNLAIISHTKCKISAWTQWSFTWILTYVAEQRLYQAYVFASDMPKPGGLHKVVNTWEAWRIMKSRYSLK